MDSLLSCSPQRRRAVFDVKETEFFSGVQGESSARCSSGELTLADLAGKYGVHPTQITSWKRQAKEGMVAAFSGKAQPCRRMLRPNYGDSMPKLAN